jgi:hypothetical protein
MSNSTHSPKPRASYWFALPLAAFATTGYAYERVIGFTAVKVPLDTVALSGNQLYATHSNSSVHLGFFFDRASGNQMSSRAFEFGRNTRVETSPSPSDGPNVALLKRQLSFEFGRSGPTQYVAKYNFNDTSRAPSFQATTDGEVLNLSSGVLYATGKALEFQPSNQERPTWRVELPSDASCLAAAGSDAFQVVVTVDSKSRWQRRGLGGGALLSEIALPGYIDGQACPMSSSSSLYVGVTRQLGSAPVLQRFDLSTGALVATEVVDTFDYDRRLISVDADLPIYSTCAISVYGNLALGRQRVEDLNRLINPSYGVVFRPYNGVVRNDDSTIVTPSCRIVALDGALKSRWSVPIAGNLTHLSAVNGQTLLLQTTDMVAGLDRQSGVQRWKFDLDSTLNVSLSVHNGDIYWLETSIGVGEPSMLRVLDASGVQRSFVPLLASTDATRTFAANFQAGRWWIAGGAPDGALTLDSFEAGDRRFSAELAPGGRLEPRLALGSGRIALASTYLGDYQEYLGTYATSTVISILDALSGAAHAQFRLPSSFVYQTHTFSDTGALLIVGTNTCEAETLCGQSLVWKWTPGSAQAVQLPVENSDVFPSPRRFNVAPGLAIALGNEVLSTTRDTTQTPGGAAQNYRIERWNHELQRAIWTLRTESEATILDTPELKAAGYFAALDGNYVKIIRLDTGQEVRSIPSDASSSARMKALLLSDGRVAIVSPNQLGFTLNVITLVGRQFDITRYFNSTRAFNFELGASDYDAFDLANLRMTEVSEPASAQSPAVSRLVLSYRQKGAFGADFARTRRLHLLWLDTQSFNPLAEQVLASQALVADAPELAWLGLGQSKLGAEVLYSGGAAQAARSTTLKSVAYPAASVIGNLSALAELPNFRNAQGLVPVGVANEGPLPQRVRLSALRPTQVSACEVLFINAKPNAPGVNSSAPSLCPTAIPSDITLPAQSKIRLTLSTNTVLTLSPVDAASQALATGIEPNVRDNSATNAVDPLN